MGRIAAAFVITDMVENWNVSMDFFRERDAHYPSIHKPMNQDLWPQITNPTISGLVKIANPIPATSNFINGNLRKQASNHFGFKAINLENFIVHIPLLTYKPIKVNEKFYPVKGWSDEDIKRLKESEKKEV